MWSPFSNIWLYGDTTDVARGPPPRHLVCLGSDWAPSGTKNLLGELKVAALWNDEALGGALDARELGAMATANAGDALRRCWGVDVGRLRAGALADVLVTTIGVDRATTPTRTCCASTSAACAWSRRRPARARHAVAAGRGRRQPTSSRSSSAASARAS